MVHVLFTSGNIASISEEKAYVQALEKEFYKHYWLLMLWQLDQFPSLVY